MSSLDSSTRVNGQVADFGSMVFRLAGGNFDGISEIKQSDSRKRAKPTGMTLSRRPLGQTPGKYEAGDMTIKCLTGTAQAIRAYLASMSPDGVSCGDVIVNCTCAYTLQGQPPRLDTIARCSLQDGDGGGTDNAEALETELKFTVEYVKWNGIALYRTSR